jgi:recombination protein RecA
MSSRHRKLDTVVSRLQVQYGPRALRRAPTPEMRDSLARLSTTFPALDAALSDDARTPGGAPRGRLTELSGPATSGKVTLAAKVLEAAHADRGALVAWLDLARTCDPDYLQRCGLDLDRLLVVRPEDGLDALAIVLYLVESNTLAALVFDSLSELPVGHDAYVAGSLAHLATAVTQTRTAVLFLAERSAEHQPLAHLAALRLRLTRERWLMQDGDVRGYEAQVEILKNRLGRVGARVPIRIIFNGTVRGDGL